MNWWNVLVLVGIAMILIGLFAFGVVWGNNATNATSEMVFGDRFDCGYINTTTTLEDIRDCYRD